MDYNAGHKKKLAKKRKNELNEPFPSCAFVRLQSRAAQDVVRYPPRPKERRKTVHICPARPREGWWRPRHGGGQSAKTCGRVTFGSSHWPLLPPTPPQGMLGCDRAREKRAASPERCGSDKSVCTTFSRFFCSRCQCPSPRSDTARSIAPGLRRHASRPGTHGQRPPGSSSPVQRPAVKSPADRFPVSWAQLFVFCVGRVPHTNA